MKEFRWIMAGLLVLCLLPVLCVLIAGLAGSALGCRVDEGGVYPCQLLGISIGPLLAALNVLGWFMLVSVPMGALVMVVWLAVELGKLVRRQLA